MFDVNGAWILGHDWSGCYFTPRQCSLHYRLLFIVEWLVRNWKFLNQFFRRAQKRRLMSWRKQADMLGEVQKSGGVRKWPWDSRPAVPLLDCNTNCHINYFVPCATGEQKSQVWACISWAIVTVDVDKHLLTQLIIAGLNEKERTKMWLTPHHLQLIVRNQQDVKVKREYCNNSFYYKPDYMLI